MKKKEKKNIPSNDGLAYLRAAKKELKTSKLERLEIKLLIAILTEAAQTRTRIKHRFALPLCRRVTGRSQKMQKIQKTKILTKM